MGGRTTDHRLRAPRSAPAGRGAPDPLGECVGDPTAELQAVRHLDQGF